MSRHGPAKRPCGSCPYRRDVPSGLWAESEYDKLPAYDRDTVDQPPAPFFCHRQDGRLCAGWVGCHDMDESFGLRLGAQRGVIDVADVEAARAYVSPVALFESGAAAAEHGKRNIADPDVAARRAIDRLSAKESKRHQSKEEVACSK